ncbi:MAG: MarR family winged helix-turn-helix transcriptional regulator [Candidatus Puniceispirillaceae bacterium]
MDSLLYDLNQHLTYRIARLQAKLNAQATDLVRRHGDISLSQWRILAVLSDPNVETQQDVLQAMGLDKGQISRVLKQLQEKDLISLALSETDLRRRHIALSHKGQDLVDRLFPIMKQRQAYLQSELSRDEISILFQLLSKLEQKTGPLNFTDTDQKAE